MCRALSCVTVLPYIYTSLVSNILHLQLMLWQVTQLSICVFILLEVYLQGKFLELRLRGHEVSVYVVSLAAYVICKLFTAQKWGQAARGQSEGWRLAAGEEGERKERTRPSASRLITLPTAPVPGASPVPSPPGVSWRPLPSHSGPQDTATHLMLSVNHCAWFLAPN